MRIILYLLLKVRISGRGGGRVGGPVGKLEVEEEGGPASL